MDEVLLCRGWWLAFSSDPLSETQVPQSKMITLVRVKLQGHFHFSDSMILLRTRRNDNIFYLELSPCLTKQFMHSRPFILNLGICLMEKEVKSQYLQPSWISATDVSLRLHFPGAHLPSATVSLEMCHIGNERQEVECSTVWLYCQEGRESHSEFCWIIQIMFPFYLTPTVNMCEKKSLQHFSFLICPRSNNHLG